MNRADIARLLGMAAAYDSRTIGETDVAAWLLALDGLDYDRCKAAVVKHYRENTDRIMPAHVRRLARTTTDIAHGETSSSAAVDPEHGRTCGNCKLMHRDDEPCTALVADDTRWRRALAVFRRPIDVGPTIDTPEAS